MTILITSPDTFMAEGGAPEVGKRYTCKLVKNPRSTGPRSLNSHTHGHYEDIAEQLSLNGVEISPETVGRLVKIDAMKAGEWPCKVDAVGIAYINPLTKELEPISEAESSSEESARLVNFIHWMADAYGWWLTEYINGRPERVYGGSRDCGV